MILTKKFTMIRTGELSPSLIKKTGDMQELFANGMAIDKNDIDVYTVFDEFELPSIDETYPLIITGSPALITDHDEWSIRTSEFLLEAHKKGISMLSTCYGHQLVAYTFGGEVGFHPTGEYGTLELFLTEEGKKDVLFGVLPEEFYGQATHVNTVTKLPQGAKLTCYGKEEPTHGFSYEENVWGTQFHPEFPPEVIRGLLGGKDLEGFDVKAILNGLAKDNKYGEILLRRFRDIV